MLNEPITLSQINKCIQKYFCREGMVVSVVSAKEMNKTKLSKFVDKVWA